MVAFDTHGFVKRLTKAGMPEPQAEVLASEQSRLIENELATKRDIAEVKRDIEQLRLATKQDIAESKADILKWMFGALLGQTAILGTLIKFL